MGAELAARVDFQRVRYANCWEDAEVLCAALRPRAGERVLSIASAGDNALYLLKDGAQVVACDLSPAQLALVELRRAAFRRLEHEELLAFLGVREASDRATTYERLEGELSPAAAAFWRRQPEAIANGVIHAGRFEEYFRVFRRYVVPLVHPRRRVDRLLERKGEADRLRFYEREWNTWRWRLLFRIFFGRTVMGRLGRDAEFFRYVEGTVGERILERTRHALTALDTASNPWLHYILRGQFGDALPPYLQPEHFAAIRDGLDRLELVQAPIEEAAARSGGGFDAFNLSDLFEYQSAADTERIYRALLAHARPGARIAYWNMLVPRRRPASLAARLVERPDLAEELLRKDRAFFYQAFVLEEVREDG